MLITINYVDYAQANSAHKKFCSFIILIYMYINAENTNTVPAPLTDAATIQKIMILRPRLPQKTHK